MAQDAATTTFTSDDERVPAAVGQRLTELLDRVVARRGIHHAMLAVASGDGAHRWRGATGPADTTSAPLRPDTPFFIASVTKRFIRPALGTGRHVKQTGGHGQYGIVSIELEPRPRDAGFEFTNASVGGVVPSSYVPSVEKGVIEAMRHGPLGGFQVVDVGVRLVDGKHHPVDSSDAAFQMAGILAFRDAVAKADPVLLEPIVAVGVAVPDDLTGAILADLSARRGRITGTSVTDDGWSRVDALIPDAELASFPADFRAITGGQGQVDMTYDHHEEVPDSVARRVLEGAGAA